MYSHTSSKIIDTDHVKLSVTYTYEPAEINNTGHPDDRLPDVPAKVHILSVDVVSINHQNLEDIILCTVEEGD